MADRRQFGFRSDKAYVRKLIKRGVWAYDVGYIPVTPRENRYLRLQDRVDFDAHEPDGFHVSGTGVDIDRNRVVIDVITKRPDAEAYFRAHYGAGVTADVIATELTSPSCADLFGYRPAPDGMSITVSYEAGGDAQFDRFELVEHPDRVQIAVVVQIFNGPTTADSRPTEVTIPLSTPLGPRKVIDTATGKPLTVEAA